MKSRKGEWEIEDDALIGHKNVPYSKTSHSNSNQKKRKGEAMLFDLEQSEDKQKKRKKEEKLLDLEQIEDNQKKKKGEAKLFDLEQSEGKQKKRKKERKLLGLEQSEDNQKKRKEKLLDLEQSEGTSESKSKRKKKNKNKKPKKTQSSQTVDCNKEKCLDYLKRWQEYRETWKFEKLRQIWLFRNMFDSTKVPGSSFQILVNYISGTRGQARKMIIAKTMEVVKTMEKWTELSEQGMEEDDIARQISSGKVTEEMYERARSILQSLEDV